MLHLAYSPQFLSALSGELPNALFLNQKESFSTSNYKSYASAFELGYRYNWKIKQGLYFESILLYKYNTGFQHSKGYYKSKFNDYGIQCSLKLDLKN
ncbi:MAG: hypothetical protein R2852_02820 [Bacteroidia bacterium]